MALAKTIDLANIGIPATYWRILGWGVDRPTNSASYSIAGYVSRAAAEKGAQPLPDCTLQATVPLADLGVASLDEVTRAHLYEHAKRNTDPVKCSQAMVDAGSYPAELLGQLVMPEGAPNPLFGATDA